MDELPSLKQILIIILLFIIVIIILIIFAPEPIEYEEGIYMIPIGYKDFTNKTGVIENAYDQKAEVPSGSVNIVVFTKPIYREYKDIRCTLYVDETAYQMKSLTEDDTVWVYENFIVFLAQDYTMYYELEVME